MFTALITLLLGYVSQARTEEGAEAQRLAIVRYINGLDRPIDRHVHELLSGHPYEETILDYLRAPDLDSWKKIRGYLLVPMMQQLATGSGHKPTLWQSLCWYAYEQREGRYERPPFTFSNQVFPAESRTYPNTEALENAILRAFGYPLQADRIGLEQVLTDLVPPLLPEADQFPGRYVVYFGDNGNQLFWESAPTDLGGRVFMMNPRGRGYWSVTLEQPDGSMRLLTHSKPEKPEVSSTTGGTTVEEAVAAVRRIHALELVPSTEKHWAWVSPKRMELTDGYHPSIDSGRLLVTPPDELLAQTEPSRSAPPSFISTSVGRTERVSMDLLWESAGSNWNDALARESQWESGLSPEDLVKGRTDEVDEEEAEDDLESFAHWVDKLGPYRFRPNEIPAAWAILAVRGDVQSGDSPWYVEDGFHRLAAARELRLPTYPVREVAS